MLNHNWDLYILDPIFILVGLLVIGWMFIQERLSFKWIFFLMETIFFWFTNGILVKWNTQQLNLDTFSNPVVIMLMFLGTGVLLSILLKPLATFLTGRVHHRRYWMYGSIIATLLGLIFTIINKDSDSIALFILIGMMLGISLSSNSLYFLFENEQFYYRIGPIISTTLISTTIVFGTFLGTYTSSIEYVVTKNIDNNYHVALFVIGTLSLIVSSLLGLLNKENPVTVRSFETTITYKIPRYNKLTLIFLMLSTFSLSLLYASTQSSIVIDFINTKLLIKNQFNMELVKPWMRMHGIFYIIPQVLLGYIIYKYVIVKLGLKTSIIAIIITSALIMVVLIFTANPYLFIVFNLFLGLAASQLFYIFFSMAIMWNYRANGIPVTGFISAVNALGQFVINIIVGSIKTSGVGIYKGYKEAMDNYTSLESQNWIIHFNESTDDIITLMFSGIIVLLVLVIVWIFFSSKIQFADYLDISAASNNIKKLLKNEMKEKINTRTNSSLLEMRNYHERIK